MRKAAKRVTKEQVPEAQPTEKSQFDRAPRQKNSDRDPVKSAEETRDVPTKHGALK